MNVGWECVKAIIKRHQEVREVYVKTHVYRYPDRPGPPQKIISPLKIKEIAP